MAILLHDLPLLMQQFQPLKKKTSFSSALKKSAKKHVKAKLRAHGRNIVGCYMLRPFAHPLTYCCALLKVAGNFGQQCWKLSGPFARGLNEVGTLWFKELVQILPN